MTLAQAKVEADRLARKGWTALDIENALIRGLRESGAPRVRQAQQLAFWAIRSVS